MWVLGRRALPWLAVWALVVAVFGGGACCLQQRFCHQEFVVVEPGGVRRVLETFGVPYGTGPYLLGALFFSVCAPKTGAYESGTLSQMMSRCMLGQQKLFLVQILPGNSDVETLEKLRSLPFLSADDDWQEPYEGFYPDSYYVAWGTSLRKVLLQAQERLYTFVEALWAQRGAAVQHLSARQMIILASIVEQETSIPEEYAPIATVYLRRLGKGLKGRMYADPTIQYVFDKDPHLRSRRKKRRVYYKDLHTKSAYNTYRNSGFPPGPVANPSPAVLRAVAGLNELSEGFSHFFWCKAERRHVFSESLREHLVKQTQL